MATGMQMGSSSSGSTSDLDRELKLLEIENQRLKLAEAVKRPPPKRWWTSLIEVLALPAAVLAIVIQLTQASGNIKTEAKTEAETVKARVDTAKAVLETEKLQIELTRLKNEGAAAPKEDLQRLVPRLQESIEQLRVLQQQSLPNVWAKAFVKYILLWVLFHLIGLIFDVISNVWSTLASAIALLVFSRTPSETYDAAAEKRRRRLRNAVQLAMAVMAPLPNVLRWSIQLSIFVALMIPLFNELASTLKPDAAFDTVWSEVRQWRFGDALASMKGILFTTP